MYASARDFFEAAREAARDAERIARQLQAMESAADGLGGGGFEPRVRSTPTHDRMAERVCSTVDVRDALERQQDEDYRLIDAACEVLYGTDNDNGLRTLAGWRADAIWHHYLGLATWDEVARLMGYSEQHVRREAMAALDTADAWGMVRTVAGVGGAET